MTETKKDFIAVTNSNLKPGDEIVGDMGNVSVITGAVYPSGSIPGLLAVETEHGVLYVDPDATTYIKP